MSQIMKPVEIFLENYMYKVEITSSVHYRYQTAPAAQRHIKTHNLFKVVRRRDNYTSRAHGTKVQ